MSPEFCQLSPRLLDLILATKLHVHLQITRFLLSWQAEIFFFASFQLYVIMEKPTDTCNCVIVIGRHEHRSVKKKDESISTWSLWAKIKIMRGGGFTMYRISIYTRSLQVLYKYTVSEITAVPLMHEYWDYCHLCLHIFLWLMSPKCCVFQMSTKFICMIFCTWCKFGDKLVSLPSLLAWHWVIFTEGVSEQYSQRITPVRYANH